MVNILNVYKCYQEYIKGYVLLMLYAEWNLINIELFENVFIQMYSSSSNSIAKFNIKVLSHVRTMKYKIF